MAKTRRELLRIVNELASDLNNVELGISALIRQGLTSDARGLQMAKNILHTRLRDAREAYEQAPR
jgi:hypothetical protein